jgi:uncharacterized pyridoxal phosphate-containing UPF0001 family protein
MDFMKALKQYDKVHVIGLMTMAQDTNDGTVIRNTFRTLKQAQLEVKQLYPDVNQLSMGMSQDFPIAIEEGATMIRVGSILFK